MERILELLILMIAVAAAAACLGGATVFLWKRRQDDGTTGSILRLAAEIDGVAAGIDSDLEPRADDPACVVLRQRCREARERARRALSQGRSGLRVQEREALITALLLLHDDHRRTVDLRSDVDRALARKAKGASEDRCRVISFGSSKPSRWPTSSLLTRPSTLS